MNISHFFLFKDVEEDTRKKNNPNFNWLLILCGEKLLSNKESHLINLNFFHLIALIFDLF